MILAEKMLIATFIILVIIYIILYIKDYKETENVIKNWNNEFCRLGNFIQNEEIVNIHCINKLFFYRLEVTIKNSLETKTETFKIPCLNSQKAEKLNFDVIFATDIDFTKWKIELFYEERINIKKKKTIYGINIFSPTSIATMEYSSK